MYAAGLCLHTLFVVRTEMATVPFHVAQIDASRNSKLFVKSVLTAAAR